MALLGTPSGCRRNRTEFRPQGRPVERAIEPSGLRPPLTALSWPTPPPPTPHSRPQGPVHFCPSLPLAPCAITQQGRRGEHCPGLLPRTSVQRTAPLTRRCSHGFCPTPGFRRIARKTVSPASARSSGWPHPPPQPPAEVLSAEAPSAAVPSGTASHQWNSPVASAAPSRRPQPQPLTPAATTTSQPRAPAAPPRSQPEPSAPSSRSSLQPVP